MLSREAFDRYDRQVRNIAGGAEGYVRRMVGAYLGQHPEASVVECREFAQVAMGEASKVYGDAAATAAADYYDSVMEAAGNGAPRALLDSDVDEDQVERVARYQAGKLSKGDAAGFVRECASYAADAAAQAANRTMLRNAKRDGKRGVRFARVPTGAETCAFCRMLASRGFVYKSERSAELFGHSHRGCNCRVVASTDASGLEGYDPGHEYELWKAFQAIEDGEGTQAEKRARMRAVLDGGSAGVVPRSSEVAGWASNKKRNAHAKKHASEYGIDYRSGEGQASYDKVMSEVIDGYDTIEEVRDLPGQAPDRCVVYMRGDDIAVVNADKGIRVTLFKHKEGYSAYYDAIWDKAHGRAEE